MSLCLITGASEGLGKEFARVHASRGGNLIICARSEEKLMYLKHELESEFGISVYVIPCDLSIDDGAKILYTRVKKLGLSPDLVINNAAYAACGEYSQLNCDDLGALLNLDVKTPAFLMLLFLRDMEARRSGGIINISSVASLMPGPFMASYYASKAFLSSLSSAVAAECKDHKIMITTVLPGPLDTNFQKASRLQGSRFKRFFTASAQETAQKAYDDFLKRKPISYAGMKPLIRLVTLLMTFIPQRFITATVALLQRNSR